ncbi:MAG TPA: tRNA guanosine(34) transglycosylase Tgt [Candidatus Paceibacterota bacterium]
MTNFSFKIENKIKGRLGRAGVIKTPHGEIHTPAFTVVGTQATVKALSPEQVKETGAEAVLANTYHLYLKPGHEIVKKAGGLHKFMNWQGPIFTDSGGFQVFSLGAAYNKKIGKIINNKITNSNHSKIIKNFRMVSEDDKKISLVKIDDEGVDFKSVVDGSSHRFTPEKSIEIQNALGADIIFAFDECPAPEASVDYQKAALDRTLRWAKRSLDEHNRLNKSGKQALFGIVQGGRVEELRKLSAKKTGKMDFDGFGIGGSFNKEDIGNAVAWVNQELPEDRPRHLLGIGEPSDIISAIENGCDTFDCVVPTRMARNGAIWTKVGRINILNAKYKSDFSPIEENCGCYTCKNYTKAYVAHLFRSEEMFAATLASIHNIHFIIHLIGDARQAILDGKFEKFKERKNIPM